MHLVIAFIFNYFFSKISEFQISEKYKRINNLLNIINEILTVSKDGFGSKIFYYFLCKTGHHVTRLWLLKAEKHVQNQMFILNSELREIFFQLCEIGVRNDIFLLFNVLDHLSHWSLDDGILFEESRVDEDVLFLSRNEIIECIKRLMVDKKQIEKMCKWYCR